MSRYDNAVLADSPTRYHKCAETSGTAWVDSGVNLSDGTIVLAGGTVLFQQPSLILSNPAGKSLREQGDGAYCIPSSINYSATLTIEFWITWADTWENEGAIPSSPANGQAGLLRRDTTLGSFQYFNGDAYFNDINTKLIDAKYRPYHLVLEWGGGNFDLWINAMHQCTIPSGHSFTSANPPQFGSMSFGTQWCWDGLIQNVAIYDGVALSQERITAHWLASQQNSPLPGFFRPS